MKKPTLQLRDPGAVLRVVLGVLLVLNLIAVALVLFPPGGSPERLRTQIQSLQSQFVGSGVQLKHTRAISGKLERGRTEGEQFMAQYFLDSASTYSTIVGELVGAAKRAGIKAKETSYVTEPIEGSDDLTMMSITGAYEGTYADLLHFVNEIDRTKRLLIIENLNAQPQQGSGGVLNISIRFDTFIKERPGMPRPVAPTGAGAVQEGQ